MSSFRIKYQTYEFDTLDIHLKTLRDNQEYSDNDNIASNLGISSATWSLSGIVWPSSKVLAHYMSDYAIKDKRILELGCGIALTSHVLNSRNANITATDYHPEVKSFLEDNTELNDTQTIPFERTSWTDEDDTLGKFDLIIGSDILYESWHINELSSFINAHTKENCEIIIVDPGRGNHAKFTKRMISLGFSHTQFKPENSDKYLLKPFKGQIIKYSR